MRAAGLNPPARMMAWIKASGWDAILGSRRATTRSGPRLSSAFCGSSRLSLHQNLEISRTGSALLPVLVMSDRGGARSGPSGEGGDGSNPDKGNEAESKMPSMGQFFTGLRDRVANRRNQGSEGLPGWSDTGSGDVQEFDDDEPTKAKRPSYLREWNFDNDPRKLDCVTAFDALVYCIRPPMMLSAYYRKGEAMDCVLAGNEFNVCMSAKYWRFIDIDKARKVLEEYTESKNPSGPHPVFRTRRKPGTTWLHSKEDIEDDDDL